MIKWNRFDTDFKMNELLSPTGLASQVLSDNEVFQDFFRIRVRTV